MRRILPSITTHGTTTSSWQDKVAEISVLGLQEVALFLTGLSGVQRKECFERLEEAQEAHFFEIPFVHAVSTMCDDDYRYLQAQFGTEAFNLHPLRQYPLSHPLADDVRAAIFVENPGIDIPLCAADVVGFAGLCIDLSHLEDARRSMPELYQDLAALSKACVVGANHISAVAATPCGTFGSYHYYSKHIGTSPEEFSYLAALDPSCFAPICAVEVENPLREQLHFIEAIRKYLQLASNSIDGCRVDHPR